jgi:hypothetical protein
MDLWSEVELLQFGPLASASESAGKDVYQGKGLRDAFYAWPLSSRCRVEEQVALRGYATKGLDNVLVSARGLFGLEVLLFAPGSETACASGSAAGKAWSALDDKTLALRKREYASVLAADLLTRARSLVSRWAADGEDFRARFIDADGYPSEQEALNVLAWSLIYVEREVKDWKLGIPAGYTLTSPVSAPEAPLAHVGIENVRANLRGFRSLFQGCGANGEGIGFDDWLVEAGHADLAKDLRAAWERADAAARRAGPLHTASQAEVQATYAEVKGLSDLLKAEFFGAGSPLNLKLPATVEGDTD